MLQDKDASVAAAAKEALQQYQKGNK